MCPSDKPVPHSAHIAVISIQAFDPELIINLSSEFSGHRHGHWRKNDTWNNARCTLLNT